MKPDAKQNSSSGLGRRSFLACGAGAASALLVPRDAAAQAQRDWSGHNPVRYPDPDIVTLDPKFSKYAVGNTPIQRLFTGCFWAEGPAWNGNARCLIWSDIPNNRQMRYIEDDNHVSVYRQPAGFSNGNTFDYEGRQLSCEHANRRVARYEPSGKVTVIADKYQGKPLNAPNDIVVHPDGGIWFTDPGYGILGNYEGGLAHMELKEAVYRVDGKTGQMTMVTDQEFKPNGLCFSPDYKKLYICDTGSTHYARAKNIVNVYDVVDGKSLRNGKQYISMQMGDKTGIADGIRADIDGNIWVGSGRGGPGYDGVQVFTPEGQRIGMILLPEICANVCFGGTRRNRLFMCASQSLYSVYVETQGAHIA